MGWNVLANEVAWPGHSHLLIYLTLGYAAAIVPWLGSTCKTNKYRVRRRAAGVTAPSARPSP